MRDTMRDILNKLYSIVSETQLNPRDPKGDYEAKKQALDDLETDPVAEQDPEISAAIDQRRADLEKEAQSAGIFEVGDDFGISFSEDFEIATEIVDILEDGIVIELDDPALEMLANEGLEFLEGELEEGVVGPKRCWKNHRKVGTQPGTGKNAGKRVNDCEKIGEGSLEANTPNPVVVIQDLKGKILDKVNLSVAAQKYKLGDPKDIKNQLAHQNYTTIGNYVVVAPMTGQPQDGTTQGVAEGPFSIDDKIKGRIQNIVNDLSDIPGYWDSQRDTFTPYGVEALASSLKNNKQYIKYALSLTSDDYFADDLNAEGVEEAKYQGREVPLGKKMAGDVKKSKVYVRKPNGNIVKVNFGDKKMRIKKSNPARRKSFRARHNCANPGPRHKARYWSCRSW